MDPEIEAMRLALDDQMRSVVIGIGPCSATFSDLAAMIQFFFCYLLLLFNNACVIFWKPTSGNQNHLPKDIIAVDYDI